MADFTRQAIRNAFLQLLDEMPLKKITVRDIVDACGVNRNTFYYYYQDIPALIESIIKDDADRIILENPRITSIEQCLEAIISFSLSHKAAVLHIYKSVNRDIFEQYQWQVCDYVVKAYLQEMMGKSPINEEDYRIIVSYIKSLCFGVAIGWLESGLEDDIHRFVHRICELKQGDLERMLELCRKE